MARVPFHIKAMPPCECYLCQEMCQRPCWGTPDEIRRIIEAGDARRLSLDWWDGGDGILYVLAPANRGYERRKAPTYSDKGCAFFANGRCLLHGQRLKPMEGRVARHDRPQDEYLRVKHWIVDQWRTPEAQALIEEWKSLVGYTP